MKDFPWESLPEPKLAVLTMNALRFGPFMTLLACIFLAALSSSFGELLVGKVRILFPADLSTIVQSGAGSVSANERSIYIEFQVPSTLINQKLQLAIGSYDPLIFVHPCVDVVGCSYDARNSTVKISIQSIDVGTYNVNVLTVDRKLSYLDSAETVFDVIPSRQHLNPSHSRGHGYHEDAYDARNNIYTSPGFTASCLQHIPNKLALDNPLVDNTHLRTVTKTKIAIISSFAHGLNGQIIMLSKIVEEMSKWDNVEIKWVTADEESPEESDFTNDNVLRLKQWNVTYTKRIMKVPRSLYLHANSSLETLVNLSYEIYEHEKGKGDYPNHLFKFKPLVLEMLNPIAKELKDFDVVHFTTRQFRKWEDQLLVIALRFANVKVVIAEPGSIENDIVDKVDAYIVPSALAKKHMELIRPLIPTFVLRPFVDKVQYARYWPIRERLHNQDRSRHLNIVYLGRLASVKSPGIFLKVVNIVSNIWKKIDTKQGIHVTHPEVKFRFVGSGPLKRSLQKAIARMGINVSFHFCLHEDLPSYLSKNVDIVVHTTLLNESFGLSNLEAMAAEIPVVTFGVGGTNEYLSLHNGNNQRGVIVPVASPERMALSIISLMTNANLRRSMGIAAREYVFKKKIALFDYKHG